MTVIGVTSRLEPGLDACLVASDKKRSDDKFNDAANLRAPLSFHRKVAGDSDNSAKKNFIKANKRKIIVMLERASILVKFVVCIGLIVNVGFPVDAATSTKGDIKVAVKVPKESDLGSYADLKCEWHVMGEKKLYSVKWYKDDHEFFRFLPNSQEKIQTFPQPGIQLDKKVNSENSIRLTGLTLNSTGQYKCEVSADGPSFATEYKTGNLTVVALPERAPEITGLSSHYAVGENVTANCTAWPSVPKATLHWNINGKPVSKEYTIVHPPLPPVATSGVPNSLGLRMEAEPRHFEGGDGSVTIRCVAYVGTRRFVKEKTVHMAHVNNQRLSAGDLRGSGTSNRIVGSEGHFFIFILVALGSYVCT